MGGLPSTQQLESYLSGMVGELGFQSRALVVPGGSVTYPFLASNPKRHGFLVHWMGATSGFLAPDPAVNLNKGITLGSGTLLRFFVRDDGIVVAAPWYIFTTAANTSIYAIEYLVQ